jgi:hypothetical protein
VPPALSFSLLHGDDLFRFEWWEDLHAFGAEAVTIDSVGVLREPNDEENDSAARGASA